jgi:hypothetical protein
VKRIKGAGARILHGISVILTTICPSSVQTSRVSFSEPFAKARLRCARNATCAQAFLGASDRVLKTVLLFPKHAYLQGTDGLKLDVEQFLKQ